MMSGHKFPSAGQGRKHFSDDERAIIDGNIEDGYVDGLGYKHLAASMIQDALASAISKRDIGDLVWLASSAATPWFDMAGVDQAATLGLAGWARVARRLLDDDSRVIPARNRRIMVEALDKVIDGRDPAYVPPRMPSKELAKERRASEKRTAKKLRAKKRAAKKKPKRMGRIEVRRKREK